MSFWTIVDTLLFRPLQLLFEVIYVVANRVIDNPGLSIVVLSLIMNFLVLPLYKRADAMQEEEREIEKRLHKGVSHIKRTFSGDERMMMLQTYYRQNNYKPTFVLRGAVSLFLEIPFFIAAYRFLSGLQLLNGVSFGPIADLGSPDGMMAIAGRTFNILPVIMTAVNLVSCIIFTKGSPLKTKIQLYAMAVFFLFFLYTSPSGLVLYWTLNNVFSLVKTIFYKLKNSGKILAILCSAIGVLIFFYGVFFYEAPTLVRTVFFVGCGILMQIPVFYQILSPQLKLRRKEVEKKGNSKVLYGGGVFMAVLTGILIPSSVIQSSPQEFVDLVYFYHPLWFIVSSFCLALGIFVIWMGVFYQLATPSVRYYFDLFIWILAGMAVLNYMFFGKNLGMLSTSLKYENGLAFTRKEQLWNLAIVFVVAIVLYLICRRWKKLVSEVLVIGILAIGILSAVNIAQINTSIKEVEKQALASKEKSGFTLSKNGKNVVILMLDRAMGEYIPYIFNEKPELKEEFSGFVYYANTISFGGHTNLGSPALYGGYEYTPLEINKRDEELLVSKHNEALKVMPVLFEKNGYEVTVVSPSYANYQWIPDLSIYDEYPDIHCNLNLGNSSEYINVERWIQESKRNFFCYGILKIVPVCFQKIVYNDGAYNQAKGEENGENVYSGQTIESLYTATGINAGFMSHYNTLKSLPDSFSITENETNTFLLMTNDITHDPMMLQEPEYTPSQHVDNTAYAEEHQERFNLDGQVLKMETELQIMHYQSNMAAMIQLGKWFEYLRNNSIYDNTRIILVSDHGFELGHFDEFKSEKGEDLSYYYPLLMVKDFDSEGFTTSEEFMTNADVPTLAMKGIIEEPRNPFTEKAIDSSAKEAPFQYVNGSHEWDTSINNGNIFLPSIWYSVRDDMRKRENWKVVAEDAISPAGRE